MNNPYLTADRVLNVIVADRRPIFSEGIRQVLQRALPNGFELKGSVVTYDELLALLQRNASDLAFVDVNLLSAEEQVEKLCYLLHRFGGTRFVLIGDSVRLVPALSDSTVAYALLHRSSASEVYARAIKVMLSGQAYTDPALTRRRDATRNEFRLTRREAEVLRLIASGLSNKDIGGQLFISDQTVSVHRKHIMRKLNANNTATLVRMAYEQQLL